MLEKKEENNYANSRSILKANIFYMFAHVTKKNNKIITISLDDLQEFTKSIHN